MFHAVRTQLAAGIESLRTKGLVGLFLFEFSVVLLGVLAAQALQGWSREREVLRETREAKLRLEQGFVDAVDHAAVWQSALPCLRERVAEVMTAAATGQEAAEGFASRPLFPVLPDYSETPEINAQLNKLNAARALILAEMARRVGIIDGATREMASLWEIFRLMDPAFGPVNDYDRAAVRLAGAQILSQLRTLEGSVTMVGRLKAQVNVEDTTPFNPEIDILPIRNCAELWTTGTAYRELEPAEIPPD